MSTSYGQAITKKDTLANYTFDQLSDKFYAAKPDSLKAVLYATYYIDKAKLEKDTLQIADGNYYLSDITKDSSYYVKYWNHISKETKKTKNRLYPAVSYLMLGDYYFQFGDKSKALQKYLLANKYCNKKNDSIKFILMNRLGMLKARNRDQTAALLHYRKSYNYYKKKNFTNISSDYFSLLYNISLVFSKTKQYDSAYYYNNELIRASYKMKNSAFLGYAINNKGTIEYIRRNYKSAIYNLKKSIPFLIKDENHTILSSTFYEIAYSNSKIGNKLKALKYYLKIDSLFLVNNNLHKHQKSTYKFLANHYKTTGNLKKQLEFINKYIKIYRVLTARSSRKETHRKPT